MARESRSRETHARVAWLMSVTLIGISCVSLEKEQNSKAQGTAQGSLGMAVTEIQSEDASGATPQCLLCHANVVLAVMESPHAKPMIGCITCHGPSEKHESVEDNSIKPDRVITEKDSVTFCGSCHGWKGKPEGTFMAAGVCEMFEPNQGKSVCVDCHDAHTTGEKGRVR